MSNKLRSRLSESGITIAATRPHRVRSGTLCRRYFSDRTTNWLHNASRRRLRPTSNIEAPNSPTFSKSVCIAFSSLAKPFRPCRARFSTLELRFYATQLSTNSARISSAFLFATDLPTPPWRKIMPNSTGIDSGANYTEEIRDTITTPPLQPVIYNARCTDLHGTRRTNCRRRSELHTGLLHPPTEGAPYTRIIPGVGRCIYHNIPSDFTISLRGQTCDLG